MREIKELRDECSKRKGECSARLYLSSENPGEHSGYSSELTEILCSFMSKSKKYVCLKQAQTTVGQNCKKGKYHVVQLQQSLYCYCIKTRKTAAWSN